jgi:4-carboxymuconolactone decarboxylase
MSTPRISPVTPPYTPEIQDSFDKIMPPGVEPLNVFRTFAHHPDLLKRQMTLGSLLLNHGTVEPMEREIVLHRTCARCNCEYEWGVHVTAYARPLGFTDEQIRATRLGNHTDPAWNPRGAILIRLADQLHETSTVDDELWKDLENGWSTKQILELIGVAGMYHAVSYIINTARVEHEVFAERFPVAKSDSV